MSDQIMEEEKRKLYAGAIRVQKEIDQYGFSPSQDYVFNTVSNAKQLARQNAEKIFEQEKKEKIEKWKREGVSKEELIKKVKRLWKRMILKQKGRAEALSNADYKTQISIFAGMPEGQKLYGKYEALRQKGEEIINKEGIKLETDEEAKK